MLTLVSNFPCVCIGRPINCLHEHNRKNVFCWNQRCFKIAKNIQQHANKTLPNAINSHKLWLGSAHLQSNNAVDITGTKRGRRQRGGAVVPAPPFEICAPHLMFGPRLLHTVHLILLKMWPPLVVFGPPCCEIMATSLIQSLQSTYSKTGGGAIAPS